jgi:HlyD family secretion protein
LIPNNSVVMPQDAEPAALALGLDAESVDMESMMGSMFGSSGMGNMFAGGGRAGGSGARPQGDHNAGQQRTAGSDQGRRGSDEQGDLARGGGGGGDFDWRQFQRGGATAAVRTERAVVFVIGEDGTIEPRMVMIGLTDWDRTQVVSGLEEGERVALIGLAQLQAQREEFLERMRSRGMNPFGGGRMGGFRGGMPH